MSALSAGAFTFLFTDIEGSTRLWEREPEGMDALLARHDRLMGRATEDRGRLRVHDDRRRLLRREPEPH